MRIVKCRKCGAKVSDQYSFCTQCQTLLTGRGSAVRGARERKRPNPAASTTDIRTKKQFCPYCQSDIISNVKFCPSCGRPLTITVEPVVISSFNILKREPILLLPILLELLISMSLTRWVGSFLPHFISTFVPTMGSQVTFTELLSIVPVLTLTLVVLYPIVYGMYPLMVDDAVNRRRVEVVEALRGAVRRFLSLLFSEILVDLRVIIGYILLIVPGIYWAAGYYYTYPAIMLEERGARDGMSSSISFSRNKKWKTFLLLLLAYVPTIIGGGIIMLQPIQLAPNGLLTVALVMALGLFSGVMNAVMSSYTYIRYRIARPQ